MSADYLKQFESVLASVEEKFSPTFTDVRDEHALREAFSRWLGPKGEVTVAMKELIPKISGEARRGAGQRANQLKQRIQDAFDEHLNAIHLLARKADIEGAPIDITLPGRQSLKGTSHPIIRVMYELVDIFTSLGFDVADGPEVDLYENNFDKLGFPPDHPATDMQDSFFLSGAKDVKTTKPLLLRTHTSTIQIREMMRRKPPLAVVAPGAVYRRDDDVTHSPMFFQVEGLLVDENASFSDLKGVLSLFVARMFGAKVPTRFRPSYFPFVEPGAEMDIGCLLCKPWEGNHERTRQCRVCKASGWLEVLGAGMVHPVVFENVGYDPEKYSGFAFGMGVDRITMLKHGISDIRLLYENDVRFLAQF